MISPEWGEPVKIVTGTESKSEIATDVTGVFPLQSWSHVAPGIIFANTVN